MTLTYTQFEEEMVASGIAPSAIAINTVPSDCQYCIQDDGHVIEVFRFERGLREYRSTFTDSQEAMAYFRSLLRADPSTRSDFGAEVAR